MAFSWGAHRAGGPDDLAIAAILGGLGFWLLLDAAGAPFWVRVPGGIIGGIALMVLRARERD